MNRMRRIDLELLGRAPEEKRCRRERRVETAAEEDDAAEDSVAVEAPSRVRSAARNQRKKKIAAPKQRLPMTPLWRWPAWLKYSTSFCGLPDVSGPRSTNEIEIGRA